MQFQKTGRAANGDWFEPGALNQDIFRGKRNLRFRSAHDSANADGSRAVTIGDHADVRIKLALDAIECFHFFVLLGAADDNFVITDFVVIEGVKSVAELEHNVIGNIDDVADAGNAGSFEAVFEPFGGRLDFHVANDASGEAAAEVRGLNRHSYGVSGFGRAFN